MKRLIGVGLGFVVVTAIGFMQGVAAQRPDDECSLPKKGSFSIGWVAEDGGKHYRCLPIFDSNLKPAGAAWIEVVRDNRFVIKD